MKFLSPLLRILPAMLVCLSLLCGPAAAYEPGEAEIDLLDKIEQDSFQYFVRMSDKMTGLTRDASRTGSPASIAATGFSLAAFAIAASNEWIDKDYAFDYLHKTLKSLLTKAQHERGFFYHFLDARSGRRVWNSEASSIDTALVIAGALLAGQYYPGTEIQRMAEDLYKRVDWSWMLNGSDLICMGWRPESGFLPYYWDSYSEHIILQALAIGSPSHPVPSSTWENWFRNEDVYEDHPVIFAHSGSLFTYQFSHAFIDFSLIDDRGVDYFENSVRATLANREYSMASSNRYQSYSPVSWGLSASVGPGGYKAYGAKPGQGIHDGTIAPYGAISSIVFTPKESIEAARYFYSLHSELYGPFGFKDAFNLDKNWWSREYLGIDQGITVLMLENYLNGGILWDKFMGLKPIRRWMEKCRLEVKQTPPAVTPAA